MEEVPNEEEMEDIKLDDKRERHWRVVFKDKDVGVYHDKAILSAKSWYVYMNYKLLLIKGGYSV